MVFLQCGVSGDVITLLQLKTGLSFKETLEFLAKRAGLDNNNNQQSNFTSDQIIKSSIYGNDYQQYTDIYKSFIDLCIVPSKEAQQWLYNRGITDHTISRMKIKYADSPDKILKQLRSIYSSDRLFHSGLVNKRGKLFCSKHPLIWTYFKDSKLGYFQGRAICEEAKPKEMNISKPIPFPYNIDILKQKSKIIIICEGVVDTLTLTEHNYNAVGIIGVHGFKKEWLSLFKGYNIKIAFDADIAGQQSALQLVQLFYDSNIQCEKVSLPVGYDINRFFKVVTQLRSIAGN